MEKIYTSKLWNIISYIVDYFILNCLWLMCSIPLFTIGAATVALNYSSMKLIRHDDTKVIKNFFSSFVSNFKQATIQWLVGAAAGGFLYLDIKLCIMHGEKNATLFSILLIAFISLAFLVAASFEYLFPLQCWFHNSVIGTFKNAAVLSVHHFGYTIALICLDVVLLFLALSIQGAILFLPGILVWLHGLILNRIFVQYETDDLNSIPS